MLMNDEQRAAYRDALEIEREGYEQRVKTADEVGDKAASVRYKNRIDQVDAEIARVDADVSAESAVDDDESAKKSK